ncbi:MAG: DDE-type integrase/transposase/recombinase [Gammaproteobacteria bacterium]|nr:DDE-type integrase/transposase/recombinase [Gammaproteobacteria bacterium]
MSDFTDVATRSGFVYVAFVIDGFACRIVGWRVSKSMRTECVVDALEQALHERCRAAADEPLTRHSERGVQISLSTLHAASRAGRHHTLRWPYQGFL